MFFGAHVSIAGGVQNAPLNATKIGCEVFQMFTRSPQGGPAPKLTEEIVEKFFENIRIGSATGPAAATARRSRSARGSSARDGRPVSASPVADEIKEWVIHTPYYINFASSDERIRKNSARIVREELERGSILKAKYVMFHPGSARDVGEIVALKSVVNGIKRVYEGYDGTTELLIEISAGAGLVIGDTFEEIAKILEGVGHPKFGVCFDTAHAFASGYDLRTAEAVNETFKIFDKTIGLGKLKMSHCNDSKVELGVRRDRHEHLGEGEIGLVGFKAIVNHPKLQHVNLYCETEPDKVAEDIKKLKKMRV